MEKGKFIKQVGDRGEGQELADYVRLTQILPPEVWLLVASELEKMSLDSVVNLGNASAFFRNLLASRRTTYMFAKVFPILLASVWKNERIEGPSVAEILKCRVVCKHWRDAIDNLEPAKLNSNETDEPTTDGARDSFNTSLLSSYRFNNLTFEDDEDDDIDEDWNDGEEKTKSVEDFLRHFDLTHRGNENKSKSPWIWGSVAVEIFPEDNEKVVDYQGFLDRISLILSMYGIHLRRFSLKIHSFEFFQNGSLLQGWLAQMPNLKYCRLDNTHEDYDFDHADLGEAVGETPFPKMRFLESMYIGNFPLPVYNQMVRLNNHVVSLFLDDPNTFGYDTREIEFPNLQILDMKDNNEDVIDQLSAMQVGSSVHTLKLDFYGIVSEQPLFETIQAKFADTLVYLSLSLNGEPTDASLLWEYCKRSRLDLPKLRKLRIFTDMNPVCLDFLLPMRQNLEEICVNFEYKHPYSQRKVNPCGTIVQYFGYEEMMLQSNIWAIFKKLRKFEVIRVKTSRVHYTSDVLRFYREDWMLDNVY